MFLVRARPAQAVPRRREVAPDQGYQPCLHHRRASLWKRSWRCRFRLLPQELPGKNLHDAGRLASRRVGESASQRVSKSASQQVSESAGGPAPWWLCTLCCGALLVDMKSFRRWGLRIAAGAVCLLAAGWIWAEARQWAYRRQAEQLLADVQRIHVGMPQAEAEAILAQWKRRASVEQGCREGENASCYVIVRLVHCLPLLDDDGPYPRMGNWAGRLAIYLGLRNSRAGGADQYRAWYSCNFCVFCRNRLAPNGRRA